MTNNKMRIYVASSWRNPWQPSVVKMVREAGHEVYDFREPKEGERGFHWSDIDPDWQSWTHEQYREALRHPIAVEGFLRDELALRRCDACVLVQPCGTSAHLELGYAIGAGKKTAVLFPNGIAPEIGGGGHLGCFARLAHVEPELMAALAGEILINEVELLEWLS